MAIEDYLTIAPHTDDVIETDAVIVGAGPVGRFPLPRTLDQPAGRLQGQYRTILSADTASEARQLLSQKRR